MNKRRLTTIEQKADGVMTVGEVLDLARTFLSCVEACAKPEQAAKLRIECTAILSKGLKIETDRISAALL